MKVFLSPSDQSSNIYATGDNEADICRKIAKACFSALQGSDVEAVLSLADSYKTRVAESNAEGADVHICIHTNAGGGDGTVVFCYPGNAENKWVKGIYDAIAKISPGNDDGIREVTNLYEINNTTAICVYVEVEFHDSKTGANWLVSHIDYIGETLAEAILSIAGSKQKWYKVVCAATDENDSLLQLNDIAYFYVEYDGKQYFQMGAFKAKENAEALISNYQSYGINAQLLIQDINP